MNSGTFNGEEGKEEGRGRLKRKKKDELRGILVILHLSDKPRGISVTSCKLLPSH
jgi:hypothetical protein